MHSFDPTTSFRAEHENHSVAGVHFHFAGLQTSRECGNVTSFGGNYGPLGGALGTLSSWLGRLNASDRSIGVLKIDCEGCELPAFLQIARQEPHLLSRVSMLLIEVHLSRSLRATAIGVQNFFELVFERHGFRLMYLRANNGKPKDREVASSLAHLGAPKHVCCYEMALVRPDIVSGLSALSAQ